MSIESNLKARIEHALSLYQHGVFNVWLHEELHAIVQECHKLFGSSNAGPDKVSKP